MHARIRYVDICRTCSVSIFNKIIPNTHRTFELCQCIFVTVTLIVAIAIDSRNVCTDLCRRTAAHVLAGGDGRVCGITAAAVHAVLELFRWAGRVVAGIWAAGTTDRAAATAAIRWRMMSRCAAAVMLLLRLNEST